MVRVASSDPVLSRPWCCCWQETIRCAIELMAAVMPRLPDVLEDETDRLVGPGDPDSAKAAEGRLLTSLVGHFSGALVPSVAPSPMPRAPSLSSSSASLAQHSLKQSPHPLADNAVLVTTPDLLFLAARTSNLSIRNAALYALSRFAYSPQASR